MRRVVLFILVSSVGLILAHRLDRPVAELVARYPVGYSYDLYTMFRLAGFLPLWTVGAAAFALIDSRNGWRDAARRGGLLFAAVVTAGLMAEVLKMLVRRERPALDAAGYVFRPWTDAAFSSSGLGWPSSHTAVAFAAACVLCRLYPRATILWLLIGAACAFSRLAGNAHFVSDVASGVPIGYGVVALLWKVRVDAHRPQDEPDV